MSDAAARFRIVHPENFTRLPARLPLTSKLIASPRALARVRACMRGRPAFIVPGAVGDPEVALAVALDVPLLGPAPAVARAVARKSGARAAFRAARMNTAPGAALAPAPAHAPSAGQHAAAAAPLGVVFDMREGELVTQEASTSYAAGVAQAHKRLDRPLCKLLAQQMAQHPCVEVRLGLAAGWGCDAMQTCMHKTFCTD